jgi:hypothetical protein
MDEEAVDRLPGCFGDVQENDVGMIGQCANPNWICFVKSLMSMPHVGPTCQQ